MASDVRVFDGVSWVSIQGPPGDDGPAGSAASVAVGTVTTLAPGAPPTVNNSGTPEAAVLDFGIPAGAAGQAATIAVGTVSSVASGGTAQVVNVGTAQNATLNFTLVEGPPGKDGSGVSIQGEATAWPPAATPDVGDLWILTAPALTGAPASAGGAAAVGDGVVWNGTSWSNVGPIRGPQGPNGAPGTAATLTVGTVTGLAAGALPTVQNTGTATAAVINFGIPAGAKGDQGDAGENNQVFAQAAQPTGARVGALWLVP